MAWLVLVTAYITVPCPVATVPSTMMGSVVPAKMPSAAVGRSFTSLSVAHCATGAYCGVSTTSLAGWVNVPVFVAAFHVTTPGSGATGSPMVKVILETTKSELALLIFTLLASPVHVAPSQPSPNVPLRYTDVHSIFVKLPNSVENVNALSFVAENAAPTGDSAIKLLLPALTVTVIPLTVLVAPAKSCSSVKELSSADPHVMVMSAHAPAVIANRATSVNSNCFVLCIIILMF